MIEKRIYGDENLGYRILARDLSPEQARGYLDSAKKDCLLEKINQERLLAITKRADEKR